MGTYQTFCQGQSGLFYATEERKWDLAGRILCLSTAAFEGRLDVLHSSFLSPGSETTPPHLFRLMHN